MNYVFATQEQTPGSGSILLLNIIFDKNNLIYLDLSRNLFYEIPAIVLKNKKSLRTLILRENNIKSVDTLLASEFPCLEKLDLGENKIMELPLEMPPTLKYLDVEYNHIRSISHLTLEKLNLTYLNMKSYYKDLVKNNIWSMKHLEELFQTIDSNTITLQSCENLKVLYVFFFGISQFNNFESFVRKCQSLRTLELTFYGSLRNSNEIIILNNIVLKELRMFSIFCDSMYKLNTSFLDNHKQLTDVSLSGEITDLDKDTFKSQQRVLYIGLTSTKLEELPETIFSYNSHLIKLNLQSNKLTNLSKNIFNNLKNLIILNLSKNQLTNLPE
uniref:Uncharacterized protein n=1 Tax=Megaselia scalaris TaxID=36166 RepID=T1GBF3_MEGSC